MTRCDHDADLTTKWEQINVTIRHRLGDTTELTREPVTTCEKCGDVVLPVKGD